MASPIEALVGVVNATQALPRLITSGQPAPVNFRALKDAGLNAVLDVRDPAEPRGFDEAALVRELGLDYTVIPVTDSTLTNETLDRILAWLRAHEDQQALMHCASANRTGGALVAHLILDQGFSEDEATMTALRAGLRGAHLLQWGLEYARTHAKRP